MWPIFSRFPEQPVVFYFVSLRSKGLIRFQPYTNYLIKYSPPSPCLLRRMMHGLHANVLYRIDNVARVAHTPECCKLIKKDISRMASQRNI